MQKLNLTERIDLSIESLKDPNGEVFDFDKEQELLLELKKVVKEHSENQNVINHYKTKVEDLNKTVSSLIVEKEVFAAKNNESINEVNKFYELMQNEIASKMRSLKYPVHEIEHISEIRNFSELIGLRDKILHEFDIKFKVQYVVDDLPKKKTPDYSMFKV